MIAPEQLAEWRRLAEADESAVPLCSEYRQAIAALLVEVDRLRGDNEQLQQQRKAARDDAYRLGVNEGLAMARDIRDERDRLRAELTLNNLRAQPPTVEHYVDENGVLVLKNITISGLPDGAALGLEIVKNPDETVSIRAAFDASRAAWEDAADTP